MNPSYEQLKAELTVAKRKLSETTELLQLALAEIANLKEKLKLNSKNSSKPPSTDQKSNTSFKDRKKRQARKGFSRIAFPPERIDKNIECFCENCPHYIEERVARALDSVYCRIHSFVIEGPYCKAIDI